MKIGVCGLGFVGSAIITSLATHGFILDQNLFVYDKYKGFGSFDDLLNCDMIFLALPTPYCDLKNEYDKSAIVETINKLYNYTGYILIKSTIEPGTCQNIDPLHKLKIIHNPEFLTARTAFHDFHNQQHIVLGKAHDFDITFVISFYNRYYRGTISVCTSMESEIMKIAINSFYAIKVQTFTEIYLMCKKMGANYDTVKEMMLNNGWINKMHTSVPGPDGNISYGGLCFPKDTMALCSFMERNNIPNKVLEATIKERNQMRNEKKIDLRTSCILKNINNKKMAELSNASFCEPVPVNPVTNPVTSPLKESVLNFDKQAFTEMYKDRKCSELNNVELLKMLLIRCSDPGNPNPVLKNGVEKLMRQLHGEMPLIPKAKFNTNMQNKGYKPKNERKFEEKSNTDQANVDNRPDFPIPVPMHTKSNYHGRHKMEKSESMTVNHDCPPTMDQKAMRSKRSFKN